MLLRFIAPQQGTILINGVPVTAYSSDHLRASIALVSQDPFIFYGTVEENLRVAKPDASAEELERALRAAHFDDVVAHLPDGLATVIGERGSTLSGGQAQRLALARAFLKDAPIVLLDEPTSQLDSQTEAVIRDNTMSRLRMLARLSALLRPMYWVMIVSIAARILNFLAGTALLAVGVYAVVRFALGEPLPFVIVVTTLVALALFKGAVRYVEQYTGHYVAFHLLAQLRYQFYNALEPQAPAGLQRLRSGDAVSRVIADIESLRPGSPTAQAALLRRAHDALRERSAHC